MNENFTPRTHLDRSLKVLWGSILVVAAALIFYTVLLLYPYNPVELHGPMKAPAVVRSTDATVPLVIPKGCTWSVGKPATFTAQVVFPQNAQSTVDFLSIDFPLKERGCRVNRKMEIPTALLPDFLRTTSGLRIRFVVKTKVNSVRTVTDYIESEPFRFVKQP